MNPRQTFKNMANTMKMAKKPDADEYQQHLRLVLLGIAGVGAIGFTIQFVFSVITFGR
jgi:protein transport protein SEC61 subunit gamma and related proteins